MVTCLIHDQSPRTKENPWVKPIGLSIDLEVSVAGRRIRKFAAVRDADGASFLFQKGSLNAALEKLDEFAEGAGFLLGHNLIGFDRIHLIDANPSLRLLKLPAVDTLLLNPLAFPRNPYHHLVKHYQSGQLARGRLNDPELDARLTIEVFRNQQKAFLLLEETAPDLLVAYHWLTTEGDEIARPNAFNLTLRCPTRPSDADAWLAIERLLSGRVCKTSMRGILSGRTKSGWELAYALAWMSVSGGNSVMPPWVRHQFPAAVATVKTLRNVACDDAACEWCRERHDPRKELGKWFGFPGFRPEPTGTDGRPLQEAIVEAAMSGRHLLGILPTGTGKSLCYQIPALSRYDKTGSLTVVISPLVALMADQVSGLHARGITSCATINGLLSMPERADVLDRVRLGDVGILIVSPEQLRNRALRRVLAQREIAAWVLDEAHCISKWGHDFRPDYRYVGRFIKEKAGEGPIPPVMCLTATAKPDVVEDIRDHFHDKLGIDLEVFDGGAMRTNLDFSIVPTTLPEKFHHIHQLLEFHLPADDAGGAIVYCASRRQTEDVASYLREKGVEAGYFHAGMPPESKKSAQDRFLRGEWKVIVATNAFGMGIDKPDVRLVVHADIPGSLENYLQEAGRAGRDQQEALCVLLYAPEDVEWQFRTSARTRLTRLEIQSILKALRKLDRKKRHEGEVVATAGEILAEEATGEFERDSATDDTRVRTAIAWLEESTLLSREENHVQLFPSSLRVGSIEEAEKRLTATPMVADYRRQLCSIVKALISAEADEGVSTDELMGTTGLSAEKVRSALYDLERLGIASNDAALTAYVHVGVERSSKKRLEQAIELEKALLMRMREAAPDVGSGDSSVLHLRHATQQLKDVGLTYALPETLRRVIKSVSIDGRDDDSGLGAFRLRRLDAESVEVTLQRGWDEIESLAEGRRKAAKGLLEHLTASLPQGARGTDLLAETTLGKLLAVLEGNLFLGREKKGLPKMVDRALLWLHEQEILRLNKGLAIFRPAMTIRLTPEKRWFAKEDFAPLKLHYDEQVLQIHVMLEYVERGLSAMAEALRLTMDYFRLDRKEFVHRWLPGREKDLERQTTPESWRTIVENLNNPAQQKIVADEREQTNVLVLAGPGSGKTRVLVHRIAYLVRVRREDPRGIIALTYNRHAAVEIRRRLKELIGDDARWVTVLTCHALAMRLVGASFIDRGSAVGEDVFREVLLQAVSLLKGEGLPPEEADEQRSRLLSGFRWILVDEYQDIGPEQYELISALAGRTLEDEDGRLGIFGVGDDDQNIYDFQGASVEFIRRFEADYKAKIAFLTENYRSTRHICDASNLVISSSRQRMKNAHPIMIDRRRSKNPAGGDWERTDPVGKGRVQLLPAGSDAKTQAILVMQEFGRLSALDSNWDWARAAVIAREWRYLDPVRAYCELERIPVQMADEERPPFWRLRETQAMIDWLKARKSKLINAAIVGEWLNSNPSGPWWDLVRDAVEEYALETGGAELPIGHFIEWLAEWGREARRRQAGLMLLTAHRAKGLEFDHVVVLDGGWDKVGVNQDVDSPRRLYYVAMTRARKTLSLACFDRGHAILRSQANSPCFQRRGPTKCPLPRVELSRQYCRLSLSMIDLSYGGRRAPTDPIHAAIAALSPGDAIHLRTSGGRWNLYDGRGTIVGRLAKRFSPLPAMKCESAKVAAIIKWRMEDNEQGYQRLLKCDYWEVVVPELVFSP
jgi:ATP-dependent DNA helicase RecQ